MSDLDEVSRQIGSLTAIAQENGRKFDALFGKMDRLNEEVTEQRGAIKLLGANVVEQKEQLVKHATEDKAVHDAVTALVSKVEAAENKGKGLAVGLTLVGGGGGIAGIISFVQNWFSGGTPSPH